MYACVRENSHHEPPIQAGKIACCADLGKVIIVEGYNSGLDENFTSGWRRSAGKSEVKSHSAENFASSRDTGQLEEWETK